MKKCFGFFSQSIFSHIGSSVRIFFAITEKILCHAVFDRLFGITALARDEAVHEVDRGGGEHAEKKEGKSVAFSFLKAHKKTPFVKAFSIVFR